MKDTIWPYIRLMRLDRPIGILLLLWPTLTALWLAAEGVPDLGIMSVFVIGVALMRSAGCVINDYADREIDGQILRTHMRPLATGELQPRDAIILFAGLCLVAFLLVLTLNMMTILMSIVAVILATLYPFMKRFTYFPQVFLGMAFGWAIPMAYTAITENVPVVAWLFFMANIIWSVIYDTFYAMADREDDILAGVKSTAILFGEDDLVIIGVLQTCFIGVMVMIGSQLELSWYYYASLGGVSALFVYQQKVASDRSPETCFQAFLNNNWVGAVLFLGIVLHYYLNA